MLDGRLLLKSTDLCTWCKHDYGEEELVLIESGEIEPMRKDPNTFLFQPSRKNKRKPLSIAVFVFHWQCFINAMEKLNMNWVCRDKDQFCCSCPQKLIGHDRHAFRCTIGGIGFYNEFEEDIEIPKQPIMCTTCVTLLFGGGNYMEGDQLLHANVDLPSSRY